jgi:hypothetical protein
MLAFAEPIQLYAKCEVISYIFAFFAGRQSERRLSPPSQIETSDICEGL